MKLFFSRAWLISRAKAKKSTASHIRHDSLDQVADAMNTAVQSNATDDERSRWLIDYAEKHPEHFTPWRVEGDISALTPAQKLALANGDPFTTLPKGK